MSEFSDHCQADLTPTDTGPINFIFYKPFKLHSGSSSL